MPRLVHKPTGSVVECSDEVAATLPEEYEPAPVEKKAPAKAAAKKSDKSDD